MFGFGKKYVNDNNIKKYKNAIKAIKFYISLGLFRKAVVACDEIEKKEKDGLDKLVKSKEENLTIKGEKIIKKYTKIFESRKKEISIYREKAKVLEIRYKEKIKTERFKKNFKEAKNNIKNLLKIGKPLEAMGALKFFLKQNGDNLNVINFYNKEKVIIQRELDRQKEDLRKKMKNNAKAEAMNLIGKKYTPKIEKDNKPKKNFLSMFSWFNFGKNILKEIEEERTLNEVNELIEEDKIKNEEIIKSKLENVHKGLIKKIKYNIPGFEIYGRILGADKISGDVFSLKEKAESNTFFLGDATGHGIRAGLIVTSLNKNFGKFYNMGLKEMTFNINNVLKQKLESKNFITGAFFSINKKDYKISYVGMGHEPIIIYSDKTKKTEKKVLGGLAAGIRIIKDIDNIKVGSLEIEDGDIFVVISDGIIEAKNSLGEYYGIDRVQNSLKLAANTKGSLTEIYEYMMEDLKLFKGGTDFDDDATILLVKRIKPIEIAKEKNYIEEIRKKEGLNKKEFNELKKGGITKEGINEKLKEIKRKREIERIVEHLKNTYYEGEVLRLKQDAIRYVKEGYIDKRINFYLRKAIENEKGYKINQKEQKIANKFKVLEELYKKGNYDTVIREVEDIITKDGV